MACINEGQGHQELRPRLPIQSNGDSSSLCGEIETLADQHEEERGGENLEEMSKENTQNYEGGGGGVGFTLGAESRADILDSLAFSIKHSDTQDIQVDDNVEDANFSLQEVQQSSKSPSPWPGPGPGRQGSGHWAGCGPSGWSRTGSINGSGSGMYSGRWSGAANYEQEYGGWDDGMDNISDLLAIRRVDSKDIVYENKKKQTKIIGNYVMGDVLGEGSYAKVKEAIDQDTLCRHAVKIMKKRKLRKIPNGEQNVQREIDLLQSLNHKNVMKLIEVMYNEEKGKIYMVLEYCCAVLQDMLEQSPEKKFPVWQSHDYFNQLLEGLEYLHSKGIIHKDLKPGNLLLDRSGTLKIADFGVCEQLDMFTESDMIKTSQGTPSFQPPEVATGVDEFSGEKLDIWSAGVSLYNFTTGDYPFQGDTIFKLFENIAKGEFSFHVPVDRLLEDLVSQLLALHPEDRPNVKQARQHDWCRKRFPINSQAVSAPPHVIDPLLSTTVLPYLENLHFPSDQPDLITEHDLHRQQEMELDDLEFNKPERKKSKTTSCIKFKNGCKTQ